MSKLGPGQIPNSVVEIRLHNDSVDDLAKAIANQFKGAPNEDRLLVIAEVADLLRVSKRKVGEMISRGDLSPIRFGRCVRFSKSQVQALIRSSATRRTRI